MTVDPSARDHYEQAREDFGHRLVAAAARRERRPVPRRAVGLGLATAVAAAAIVAIGLPSPGKDQAPLVGGASDAVAAVTQLRDVLAQGVLVRRAELTTYSGDQAGTSINEDWTNLATRQQHMRGSSRFGPFEYWNPSEHGRWTYEAAYRSKDGRKVVTYEYDEGSGNMSAAASPLEEIQRLLRQAKAGELTTRKVTKDGESVTLVERQSTGCEQTPDGGMIQCPELPRGDAPDRDPQTDLEGVTQFERWWIKTGASPRLVAYDNGVIPLKGTDAGERRRYVTITYPVWKVLPATEENLKLVNPPEFPADDYLVLKGRTATLSKAIKRGELVCADTGEAPTRREAPNATPSCPAN